MKHYQTFEDLDFHSKIYTMYFHTVQSVKSAALGHVNTINNNNPYHFEYVVEEANRVISNMSSLYNDNDERRKQYELLSIPKLIEEAKEFFNKDHL